MAMRYIASLAIKNIGRHPGKNTLVGVLMFIAFTVFFLTSSLSHSVRSSWRGYFSSTFLGAYNATVYQALERDYTIPPTNLPETAIPQEFLASLQEAGIDYGERIRIGALCYNRAKRTFYGQPATVVGMDIAQELPRLSNLFIEQGSIEPTVPNRALVWKEYAVRMGWKTGDVVICAVKTVRNATKLVPFRITGILSQKLSARFEGKGVLLVAPIIFVDLPFLSRTLGRENGPTDLVFSDLSKVALLSRQPGHDRLQFFHAEQGFNVIYGIVEFIELMGKVVESFILAIFVVSSLNIQMMSHIERRAEFGMMLAVGTPASHLIALLAFELLFLATLVFSGSLFIYVVSTLLLASGIDFGESAVLLAGRKFMPQLVPSSVPRAYGAVLLAMVLSSAFPSWLSIRTRPARVLRDAWE